MKKIFIAKTLSLKSRHEAIVYQRTDLCDAPDKRFEFHFFQFPADGLLFAICGEAG